MNLYQKLGIVLQGTGFIYFFLRGFISSVNSNGIVTDIFGLPILELGKEIPGNLLLPSLIGTALPFLMIGLGMYLSNIAKEKGI